MTRKDSKYHGGMNNNIGIEYELRFAIKKLVEMLLPTKSGIKITKVTRQKKEFVDDVIEERSNRTKTFHQCKHFKNWVKTATKNIDENNLWLDFISQFNEDSSSDLVLVTQNKDSGFDDLVNLSRNCSDFGIFKKELEDDPYHKAAHGKFQYLVNLLKETNSEIKVFSLLQNLRIASYDDYFTKEDYLKMLKLFFSDTEAENISNLFHGKLNSDWLGKEIDRDLLLQELNKLKVDLSNLEAQEKPVDSATVPQQASSHFLENQTATFSQKLDYLFRIINKDEDLTSEEINKAIVIITADSTLSWHFLKNLKDPAWFSQIVNNIIKAIVEDESDSATKYQLLSFFEKCASSHSDEMMTLLLQLERNTQSYHILSNLVRTVGLLKPKSKEAITSLWQIFDELVEHQHPWVRREIPKALLSFIDLDEDRVFDLFKRIFEYSPPPQDVTQGSPTLALTFQGRDNENWVFEEAIQSFSELLSNPKYAEKAHALGIEVEKNALSEDGKLHDSEEGIILDYSSIWLSNKSFDSERLEYNHDRKERVILEIEKSLSNLVIENQELVTSLLDKLLTEKYEVFHLTVIKVLTRHLDKFTKLGRVLIFDPKLWKIYNIRNYFLQTLTTTYFKTASDKEIRSFVKIIGQQKLQDDKKTLYLKQSMLVSIPDAHRTQAIIEKLDAISESLKVNPKIAKPFAVTTWSGIRPDIKVEELKTKSEDELLQVMIDSTNGKRAASYDIAPVFAQLIDQKPAILPGLLISMKGKNIAADFAGEMVDTYCKKLPEEVTKVADLIPLLNDDDTWARIELARYFNEICRKKEILGYMKDVRETIRDSLITLTKDKNPESDGTITSNNPRPDDAITRGINSVRGIATEALVAYSHYFSDDKVASDRLIELADDPTKAVKATLIHYLRYLIGKNFPLCEEIVGKFKNRRDPEIDFALIHFFSQLDCEKFLKYQDFIKLLFNNTDDQINEDLGELIGYRFINGCNVQVLLDEIIGNRKGTKHTIRSLAFVLESQMGNLIGHPSDIKVASYLKKLLGPQNEIEVAERAAFVFHRTETRPEHFDFMDKNGLTTELILNKFNLPAQSHLVDYLQSCVEKNISVERCVELLNQQVKTADAILSDHLIVKKIAEIVAKLIKTDLPSKTHNLLLEVFNAGLEKGWDEFYEIYFNQK
jgi:hypothetical protein